MDFTLIIVVLCLAVLAALVIGLNAFRKGGEENRALGNKMMRWRLGLQAIAVIVIVIAIYIRQQTGG